MIVVVNKSNENKISLGKASLIAGIGLLTMVFAAPVVEFYFNSFRLEWGFGLLIFGVYLLLLGYLVFRASYIPKIYGILLLLAGFGYVINTLGSFWFPDVDTEFLTITSFGEIAFMFWLLIKGAKIEDREEPGQISH